MSAHAKTDKPIRIAVAGLGKMGIMHAAMMKANPAAEVVGLVDLDANIGKQVRSMGIEAPHYSTIEKCLAEAAPDGVVVATPQFTHRAVAEACLNVGVAVMCEKPLAHTLADARAMAQLARSKPDVPAGVGYMLGHHPLFAEAARLVAAGTLGDVQSVRASCFLSQVFSPMKGWTFQKKTAGGGVLINSGPHLLYVLLRVLGPVRSVAARGSPVHNEVEDTFSALVDFESGVWGSIDVTWSVPGYEFQTQDLLIEGTNGPIEVGNEVMRVWLVAGRDGLEKGWTESRRSETEGLRDGVLTR